MPSTSDPIGQSDDRKRLLVLAIDGMDSGHLQELAESNLTPYFSALLENGTWAPVGFPLPRCPESGWTSVATGMLPDRHGVLHANVRVGESIFVREVTAGCVRAPALWHYAQAAGMRTAVIGWPATLGLSIDNCLTVAAGAEAASGRIGQAWPLHPDAVSPPSMRDMVRRHRLHPDEIRPEDIDPMLSPLSTAARQQLHSGFTTALAGCATLHAVGTWAMSDFDSDVLILRFPFLSVIDKLLSRVPSEPGIQLSLTRCYQFLDLIIGRYQNLAGRDATYAVISNGSEGVRFKSGSGRGNGDGFLVLNGPHIRKDAVIGPVAATDILPTIATLFDWKIDLEPDGEPIVDAMTIEPDRPGRASSRRTLEVMSPADIGRTTEAVLQDTERLKCEGIQIPDFSAQVQFAQQLECETLFALAEVQLYRGQDSSTLSLLRDLSRRFPEFIPVRILLAEQLLWTGETDECEAIVREFPLVRSGGMWADLAYGLIAHARKDWAEASMRFERLASTADSPVNASAWLGWMFAERAEWPQALHFFGTATEFNVHDARAWEGLGLACINLERYAEAASALGRAVSLRPRSAELLLRLCGAWEKCGEPGRAAHARWRAMKINPAAVAADILKS